MLGELAPGVVHMSQTQMSSRHRHRTVASEGRGEDQLGELPDLHMQTMAVVDGMFSP